MLGVEEAEQLNDQSEDMSDKSELDDQSSESSFEEEEYNSEKEIRTIKLSEIHTEALKFDND